MPIKKSAKKQLRQNSKRRKNNELKKKKAKELLKKISLLIEQGKNKEAQQILPQAYQALDKMAKAGVIKKNTASGKNLLLPEELTDPLQMSKIKRSKATSGAIFPVLILKSRSRIF